MDRDQLKLTLRVLKALGVRVKNNSEDEFEEDGRVDQLRSDQEAAPARTGDGPRRSAEEAAREWAELLPGSDAPSPEPAHTDGDERPDTAGQAPRTPHRARSRKAS